MKINGGKTTLKEFLNGKSVIKVYVGKDNWCRCGCGGAYYYKGDKGFVEALEGAFQRCNSMRRSSKLVLDNFCLREPTEKLEGYINIPMPKNQCYCVYYK